jgi:hypothetical protein
MLIHRIRGSVCSEYSLNDIIPYVWTYMGGTILEHRKENVVPDMVLLRSTDSVHAVLCDLTHHPARILHDHVVPHAVVVVLEIIPRLKPGLGLQTQVVFRTRGNQSFREHGLMHAIMALLDMCPRAFVFVCVNNPNNYPRDNSLPKGFREQLTHEVDYYTNEKWNEIIGGMNIQSAQGVIEVWKLADSLHSDEIRASLGALLSWLME